jgi:DnaJ-class molecular chaperone
MNYVKCPICNGSGTIGFCNTTCTVCLGKQLISELTGLPPETYISTSTQNITQNDSDIQTRESSLPESRS